MADFVPKKVLRAPPKAEIKPPTVDFVSGGDMAGIMVQCTGLQSLEDNIRQLGPVFMNAAGFEMEDIARDIILDAMENYVPVLDDVLRQSGGWDSYQAGKGIGVTEIGMWFGAATEVTHSNISRRAKARAVGEGLQIQKDPHDYALDQHENLSYRHTQDMGAGPMVGAKYLERPFIKAEPTIVPRIARAIDVAIGGGFTGLAGTLYNDEYGELRQIGNARPATTSELDAIADRMSKRDPYPGYGSGHK